MPPIPTPPPEIPEQYRLRIEVQKRPEQKQKPCAPQSKCGVKSIRTLDQQQIIQKIEPDCQKEEGQQSIADHPALPVRIKKYAGEQQLEDHHHKKDLRQAEAHGQ